MSVVQIEDYSSDENGRSVQSNEDIESEYTSCNESKKRGRKPKHRSKSKSKNVSEKSGKKKKSNRRKSSCDDSRYGSDDMKNKVCDNSDVDIKKELLSDDVQSAMSDINPPSLVTRLRQRKLERRRASRGTASSVSTCSTLNSDRRKTLSEPILITIDSDSEDDDISTVTARPNRTARVHGEIIRKFGKLTRSNVEGIKYAETTEYDSEDENDSKKKRKKKKKSIKQMSFASDVKKHGTKRITNKRKLDAKKLGKSHIHMYSPLKQTRRLKIRNLRNRFEHRQKKITLSNRAEVFLRRTSSRIGAISSEKRQSPRRSSLTGPGNCSDEKEPVKVERPKRKVSSSQIKIHIKEENEIENLPKKKTVVNNDIEDDIRKIVNASKPSPVAEDKCVKPCLDAKDINSAIDSKCNFKASDDIKTSQDNIDNITDTNQNADDSSGKGVNDAELKSEDLLLDSKKDESKRNIESDLEKIRTNTPDTMIEAPVKNTSDEERKKKKGGLSSKPKSDKGSSHKKKNVKVKTPIPGIIRKRGRPRLSESNQNAKPSKSLAFCETRSHVAFLQNSFCFDVASKLSKCRECRLAMHRTNRRMYNSYCRFMEYRKLCFSKTGQIFSAGFSRPADATIEHLSLWLPQPQDPPKDLNFETAKSLLEHTGDQFCDLIEQEKEALSLHIGNPDYITWKRNVQGVREMCDVCSTTIFNIHWVCPTCGFSVCIDCYKVRKLGAVDKEEDEEDQPKDRDEFNWLLCTMRQPHDQKGLVLTQMIPGDALWIMKELLHKARLKLGIPSYCKCNPPASSTPDKIISTGINKQLMSCVTKSFTSERNHGFSFEKNLPRNDTGYDEFDIEISDYAMKWLEGTSVHGDNQNNNLPLSDNDYNSFEDFNLLSSSLLLDNQDITSGSESEGATFSLDDIIASVTKSCQSKDSEKNFSKHFNKRYPQPKSGRDPLPIRIYTKIESDLAFSTVPHSWFCNGRLLFLDRSDHKDNLALFQELWKRGQPVLVKNVQNNLDMSLWHPDGFCRDFGDVKNDLVDCKTGAILKSLPMRKFWEGFENFGKRLTDENNEYMLLKLKDWPPGEDFSEKLPTRFLDLMKGLPLPEYTHRNGILNLAGRLPSFFVRPDLGPKMYNAYGSALYPTKGTTNLHLDVSDAVNVMVYVGIPLDGNSELHIQEALKAIDEGGCDSLMRARVRQRDTKPGALWHIYNARDADKIRDLLNKVAIEKGEKLEAHNDPIHDQSWYLDAELRLRLYREYGVEGYAIAQCLGDAVFIPAGAPHQVRNLHSCVKVAEDFVSPENIAHCFKLTQEFRNLSDTHTNHEDKLQIKNIIYHVIKDSLSHLLPPNEPLIAS